MSKRIFFVLAAFILALAGIYFRAANAHAARQQVSDIIRLDAASQSVATSVASLKVYVASHMGASVNFTLDSSFKRAQAAAQAIANLPDPNAHVYADAQKACSGKSDSITQAHCNQAYLATHLVTTPTPSPVPAPTQSQYQYDLRSPFWSPDLAGALLLGAAVSAIMSLVGNKSRSHS
jgi:hypothetical protein